MINIYVPSVGKEELKAVEQVFDSNWLGRGNKTEEFIKAMANKLTVEAYEGVVKVSTRPENLIALNSCTEALFQTIELLDIKDGDEVILPSISFIGAVNPIVSRKAIPVYCDVDPFTLNTSAEYIEEKITSKTKAVIVLHYAGRPCDLDSIISLCKKHNITLIEDNANSPFSTYNGVSTGTIGDIGVWSFDAMKIMTLGDAGLVHCNNLDLAEKFRYNSYLGLKTSSGFSNKIDAKWWEFDIAMPGRRSIINDIAAAIGIEQLKKVDSFISRRKEIHTLYDEFLTTETDYIKIPPKLEKNITSSYYMYHIQFENEQIRDKFSSYLKEHGIYTTFRYYPLHMVPYLKDGSILPNTEKLMKLTLCIPLHQSLTDIDLGHIFETIKSFKKVL